MNLTRRYIKLGLLGLACGVLWSHGAETPAAPLRIWSISPDAMDIIFMSATAGASGTPNLAFNHRNGRTAFRQVGERLGSWTIAEHRPETHQRLNPQLGSVTPVEADRVILASPEGVRRTLALGRLFPVEGYRALLIDLQTGTRYDVRTDDTIWPEGVGPSRVTHVTAESVDLDIAGVPASVAMITADEVAELQRRADAVITAARYEQARLAQRAAQRQVDDTLQQLARAPKPAPTPPQKTFSSPRGFFFGTEGPIPVEYTVLMPLFDHAGRLRRGPIVVPTRFETGAVAGFGYCSGPRRLPTVRFAR